MSKNQKIAFWSMFLVFAGMAIEGFYDDGTLASIQMSGGVAILVASILIVAFFIRKYVISNPDEIDSWFKK